MKKIYLLFLFVFAMGHAQTIAIPDANFKSKLLLLGIDTSGDGNIQVAEAAAVTVLNLSNQSIANLTGLEYFVNLTNLNLSSNTFSALNLTTLNNLQHLNCGGTNNLTQLDVSPCPQLLDINVTGNHFTGIDLSSCPLLQSATVGGGSTGNTFTSLNVSGLGNLQSLIITWGTLSALDLNGLVSLAHFENRCKVPTLDFTGCPAIIDIESSYCHLQSLDVSGCTNLQAVTATSNDLTTINVSGCVALVDLILTNNDLTSIDISGLTSIQYTSWAGNPLLTTVNASGCTGLLSAANNGSPWVSANFSGCTALTTLQVFPPATLQDLDFSNCPNIRTLILFCSLTSIDVSSLSHLTKFTIDSNVLNSLNISGLTEMNEFDCNNSLLPYLDLSEHTALNRFGAHYNSNLSWISLKNGRNEAGIEPYNNPNLRYICADESQAASLTQTLAANGVTNIQVNTYCDFVPGGLYNSVTGAVRLDTNNNGCDGSDLALSGMQVNINDGVTTGAAFTNAGNYVFDTQRPNITLTPVFDHPYFNVSPATATLNFPVNNGSIQNQDFCVVPNGTHNDLEMVVIYDNARPGFDSHYTLLFRNKGNQTLSGNLAFTFDDTRSDFIVSSVPVDSQSDGSLVWNYTNLLPFESRTIELTLNINSPTEIPAVNSGDILNASAAISPSVNDDTPFDNTYAIHQNVVNAFDPNNKICLDGPVVAPQQIGKHLYYTVNFENTGTTQATNIVVRDIIDSTKYDINSLQFLYASHPVVTKISGNKVEFIFEDINLDVGAHGNVVFKIKTKNTLTVGSSVSNQADIFFDYNFPVVTDPAVTTFQVLGVEDFEIDESVAIFPNPATDFVTVKANSEIQSVTLFDAQGRSLMTQLSTGFQVKLDTTAYSKGVYLIKVETVRGSRTEKMILK